jgi:two-component system sensor histidine kinase AlgZ
MASPGAGASPSRLPREAIIALAVAPILVQPMVNADFFRDPARDTAVEIASNYLPALAILGVLLFLHRFLVPCVAHRLGTTRTFVAAHMVICAAGAAIASGLAFPIHAAWLGAGEVPLVVYLQRNVGLTCLVVLPAVVLQASRMRVLAAERRIFEQEKAALRAQLESRTQPHFLFNVLNTISSLIHDDAELAERTIARLSDILRHALRASHEGTVPLSRELEIVDQYLEIQRARFGPKLRFEIAVAPDTRAVRIPPFLVHPLVENAVLHGVASRREGGSLRISCARRGDDIAIRVDDDGPGPGASKHRGTGTSLADLAQRLTLVYGGRGHLETHQNTRGGFTAQLTFPAQCMLPAPAEPA